LQQKRYLRAFSWKGFLAGALLASLFLLTAGVFAGGGVSAVDENGIIYQETDPAGDDHGPGGYIYPRHEVFAPGSGLFDIREFTIEKYEEEYIFTFKFKELKDPWQGLKGFSHPLIHIYFDTSEGGQSELFRPGAGVELCEDHPWNYHLRLSGWWLRKMVPEDDPHELIRDLDIDAETSPWDVEKAEVSVDENLIEVELPRHIFTDPLQGADFHLFVGSFDPFGDDYFRPVEEDESNWSFAAPDRDNLDNAPRVIDWFHPREEKQEEILADFDGDEKARLTPISIPPAEEPGLSSGMRLIYSLVNLFIGGVIILVMVLMIRGVFMI